MDSLIIYGFGVRGKSLYSALQDTDIRVKCVIDSNSTNWGKEVAGVVIVSPEVLETYNDSAICITVSNIQEKLKIRREIRERYDFCGEEYDFFDLVFAAYEEMYYKMPIESLHIEDKEKILFDCHKGLVMGGIELWTKELCMELIGRGWEQLRIICDDRDYNEPTQIADIIDKVCIDHKADYSKETFWNAIHYLETQMPFIVVTCLPDVFLMAACVLKKRYPNQINIISVIHHGEEQYYGANIKFKDSVNYYIGVSEDIKKEMLKRGADEKQVLSMTCPIQCDEELERVYSVSMDVPVRIGYAGRLVIYKKRMDLLLKMLETLENFGVNYRFEIAGEGPAGEMMENFVKQHSIADKVVFRGAIKREQLPDFWKQQDICINISDCEGRCISKMEGMAGGAVPIVTNVAGTKEDINDGVNGYIVAVGDYKSMAERINYLAKHRELIEIMGRKAHDSIFPKCQMSKHILFWEKVLTHHK